MIDRRQIIEYFDSSMASRRETFLEDERNPFKGTLLKSTVVESNVGNRLGSHPARIIEYLESSSIGQFAQIGRTEDRSLIKIDIQGEEGLTVLDTLDDRFWVLHSTLASDPFDRLEGTLTRRCDLLDSLWISTEMMLEWLPNLGRVNEIGVKFGSKMPGFSPASKLEDSVEGFSLRWSKPGQLMARWNSIADTNPIASRLAVWSGKLSVRHPQHETVASCELTAYGRVTARGDSFLLHQEIVGRLVDNYRELLASYEENFRPRIDAGSKRRSPNDDSSEAVGVLRTGRPARIIFPESLEDDQLRVLLGMFSAIDGRMRLYGVPYAEGPNRYFLSAIDLHSSDRVSLEILRTHLTVHLGPNACGNVLARLVTNLQHHFDARIRVAND